MSTVGAPIFVGRDRELDQVRASLDHAAAGDGGLLLLVGEPGIGKTRLADEATAAARARGFEVAWGRCWEGESPPAYLPWTQIFRTLRGRGLNDQASGWAATALAPILPELGPSANEGEAAGFALLETALEHLAEAAVRRPHLLVLDDLHAADAGSLRLLEFVVRGLRGMSLLIIASYRDVEARLSPAVAPLLGRIAREGRALILRRLDQGETAALAGSVAGHPLRPSIVEELQRATDGNPLFVHESVALLAVRGELEGGTVGAPLVTGGTADVIRGRLLRMSSQARRALEVASVLGREFDAPLAHALLAGQGVADPEAALAEAAGLGFIGRTERSRYRLSHAVVREAIYESVPLVERRALHLAASELYQAAAAGSVENDRLEAAYHALSALPSGNLPRAIDLGAGAAERLAQRLAFEAAAEMYQRVLGALPVVPASPLRRCDLLIALARCQVSAGAIAAARTTALEAAALARAALDGRRLAAAALAFGSVIRIAVVDAALVGLLEEALTMLPTRDTAVRPVVMARLAGARQPAPDPRPPMALAREAIALARSHFGAGSAVDSGAGAKVLIETLHAGLAALVDYAPPAERLSLSRELATLSFARGDRALTMHALARAVIDHLELGDVANADADIERLEALARQVGHPRYLWRPLLMRAMRAAMSGRHDLGAQLREEVRSLESRWRSTEDPNLAVVLAMQGYALALERGDAQELEAAGAALEISSVGMAGLDVFTPIVTALGYVRSSQLDRARLAWAGFQENHSILIHDASALVMAAEVAAALDDRRRAALLERHLTPWSGHHVTLGQMGLAWLGPCDRALGLLAAARGAPDEARTYLERALAAGRAVGALPFASRVERELAGVLGADIRTAPPRRAEALTMAVEGDVWVLSRDGQVTRLKNSRGLQMLERLVREPGRPLHVMELVATDDVPALDTGDAGFIFDADAREAYRRRYLDLEETIAEAESQGDPARATKARDEREALAAELARGVGLGGRSRRAGAAVERARVNAQRRLKDALERVAAAAPQLGRHLDRTVRTGTFCVYDPARD